ncbi:uncharacterized protein LOC109714783 [Ananas comosus]|uniref:Uncharacterized protein LOC109714783 n=1 Tax=Ananas comosus TaxID=4615 RepID=A0A6P5FFL2_ANACO|nr:uncharacterized protein LOC109714783 [Ananas comosus]
MACIPFSLPAPEITCGRSHSSLTVPTNSSHCCVAPKIKRLRLTTTHLRRRRFPCKPLRALQPTGPEDLNHLADKVPPSPLLELTQKFYSSLNDQDIKSLEKLIAPGCKIEDKAYYKPLQGKSIHKYFERLVEAMGKNVTFTVDEICEGGRLTIAIRWHLEWKGKKIPFTNSCSFYKCSRDGEALLIKEAHVFVESPLKPGDLAPKMLKLITFLFDRLPNLAESFLNKPDAVVYYVIKFCQIFVKPLILPLVAYYSFIWAFVAKILAIALSILRKISKIFG